MSPKNQKRNNSVTTLYLVLIAIGVALNILLTMFIRIPWANGYVNFGDAVIFLCATLLGPMGGLVVGGIGSGIADLFGYPVYAPFTIIVKGLEGLVCAVFYHYLLRSCRSSILRRIISMVVAGIVMTVGYFFVDVILTKQVGVALWNFVSGPIQFLISTFIAIVVMPYVPNVYEKMHAKIFARDRADKEEQAPNTATKKNRKINKNNSDKNKIVIDVVDVEEIVLSDEEKR